MLNVTHRLLNINKKFATPFTLNNTYKCGLLKITLSFTKER